MTGRVPDGRGSAEYPPEPWRLRGDFAVGVFLVRARELPAEVVTQLPRGARPLRVGGRVVVGVAAVRYSPEGVLSYDELLVALPVVHGRRCAVTIPQIWVTSAASRAGGRELWAIPKQLMAARRTTGGRRMAAEFRTETGEPLAAASAQPWLDLPGVWTVPLPTLQRRGEASVRSSNSVRGSLHLARTAWTFDGPLTWLAGRRPVAGAAITRAAVMFGTRVER